MDAEKITQELNRRFSVPLPEFYKRRVIFWIDEDQEFADKLDEISISGAKVVTLTESNNFYVKKLLAVDDPNGNYLVYRPFGYDSDEDNWLLDLELYGEEFRADLISMYMDEMSVQQTPALRHSFKQYRKFFNAQSRRNKVIALGGTIGKPAHLQLAIMAALAGAKSAKPDNIIKAVLLAGLSKENNAVYQEFINYEITDAFWTMVKQGTGYDEAEPELDRLAAHVILTAAARTIQQDFFAGLESFIATVNQAYCYDFISDWIHSKDVKEYKKIAHHVENELKLPQRFIKLQEEDLISTEVLPCINEVVLVKLMGEIGNHIIDIDHITRIVEIRRTLAWYDDVKVYYEGILQVARMQAFFKQHSGGFHTVEPSKVWKEYADEYYKMDTYYREFHKYYSESLKNYHEELSDLFTQVMETVEGLYSTWFLDALGTNWSDACKDELREYGRILDIPQQTDFYYNRVRNSDNRIYVVISDALRYEVAASLAEQLKRETQAKVELSSMQAIFPTITKFGMAALLPHDSLSVELKTGAAERLAVLADGQSTEAPNRDKVLKKANSASVALKYKSIIGMKRAERQELVKGMDVVYIYHDTIDEAGHLEKTVFAACDEAIDELKTIIRIITNDFGGANIIITSDHGFLYTHSPLTEDDKVDKTTESDQDIEVGRRYAIMKKEAQPQYLMPIKFLEGSTPYEAYSPRESIRIKMKGGGLNFVHGGISLQEMVVPVIEYHFLRNQYTEYKKNKSKYDTKQVEISLLSANRRISNMIFSLSFYQKEAVGGNREAATYQLYFMDENGKKISDIQKIIADKTSDNGQDRTFRCSFNLKSLEYKETEPYYLIIADENGLQIAKEEFEINIAFAVDDFNFF